MVVSTAQVDDCEDSSSFLMERLLQALLLSGTDLVSARRRGPQWALPARPQGRTVLIRPDPLPHHSRWLPGSWSRVRSSKRQSQQGLADGGHSTASRRLRVGGRDGGGWW